MKIRYAFFSILLMLLLGIGLIHLEYPIFNYKVGRWSIGFNSAQDIFPNSNISSQNIIPYSSVHVEKSGAENYLADPFFIKEKDTFYIFAEDKGLDNANISLFISTDGKNYQYRDVVLDEKFHLSYPQVFKVKDEFYMLPETKGSGHVILYKADNFPYSWKIEDTLIKNIKLTDPTILLSPELNLIVAVDDHLKQFMFTADSLRGEWGEADNYKQKLGNETRPGGRFFKYRNDWYLPIQDRSKGYGSGISIYKLSDKNNRLELNLAHKEYLTAQKDIKWFNRGMHHLDIQKIEDAYYMVYDGDRNENGESNFQIKRSLQLYLLDIYNYFKN